jgi:hypothetical protein
VITNAEQNPKFKTFVKWFQFAQILGAGGELGLGITRSVAVNGARFLTRVPVLTPKVKDGCKLFVQAWQEYKLAAVASGLRSGANPSGMIANEAGWTALSTKCDALSAQIAIWFPELLQRIDVSIDGLYDAAKAMRARVAANGNLFSSVVPLTPKTAAAIAYGFAYCLKVGKDATKRSLAGLLQHIRSARGQINGLEAVPDELVDEVGRLQSAEFEGLVALADEARLTSVEDAVAGFNIAGNSMERAGRLATLLGEQYAVVIAKCKELNLTAPQLESLISDFTSSTGFLAAVKSDGNVLKAWKVMLNGKRAMQTRTDLVALAKTTEVMQDTKVAAALNASGVDLVEIIAAYKGFYKVKGYAERLEDLKLFCNKFHDRNIPGFGDMLKTMKNQNAMVQDGMQHALIQLNKVEFDASKVKKFDMDFELAEGFDCPTTLCKFDVEMIDGNTVRFYEFKSYQDASKISLNQFKSYISRVSKPEELRYIFNKNKITDISIAKSQMANFIKNNQVAIVSSMNIQFKASLNIPLDALTLSEVQINNIVEKIVLCQL